MWKMDERYLSKLNFPENLYERTFDPNDFSKLISLKSKSENLIPQSVDEIFIETKDLIRNNLLLKYFLDTNSHVLL